MRVTYVTLTRLPTTSSRVVSSTPKSIIKTAWGKIPSTTSSAPLSSKVDKRQLPLLALTANKARIASISFDTLSVQPPAKDDIASLQDPERLVAPNEDNDDFHPVVYRKKAKRAQCEAKHKAKKGSESFEEILSPTEEGKADSEHVMHEPCEVASSSSVDWKTSNATDEMTARSSIDSIVELTAGDQDRVSIEAADEQMNIVDTSLAPSSAPIPRTTHGKH